MSMVYGPLFPNIKVVSNIKNSKDRNDSESKDIGGWYHVCVEAFFKQYRY